ncbi:uncharacterized protein LOC108108654 [Drosophila eugracilis]|uniref:uncharacterized protein LOC108108654 n=1 Tax=Drosophila eugracilis TaxID=29029 RepID=UPI0007E725F2|nr:uncharacterized protein LOC108108654 [Drosophila eugracilis]
MFRLIPFKNHLCYYGNGYDVIADACRDKRSFLSFLESRQWRSLRRIPSNFFNCDISTYPIYYWFVLIFSLYGTLQGLIRFSRVLFTQEVPIKWEDLRFYVMTPRVIKRFRILNAFININIWAILFYAAIYVSPSHMSPWLWAQMLIFASKLAAATMNTLSVRHKGQGIRTTIYLIVYMLAIWFVYQARRSFIIALKQETPEKLMLSLTFIQRLSNFAK